MSAPLSKQELCTRFNTGELFSFLYFWGHTARKDGGVSSSCFSQWFVAPFEVNGQSYQTAEHYMMAEKARLFADIATLDRILNANNPGAAKAFGREVLGFDQEIWDAHRYEIVVRGNLAKFSSNRLLSDFLIGTGRKILVEASPLDPIWGIGLAANDLQSQNPNHWKGSNLLGFALMEVRECISQ